MTKTFGGPTTQVLVQAVVVAVVLATSVLTADGSPRRPYRVDDRFAIEEVETRSLAFSPDGEALAFARRRSALSQLTNGLVIQETRDDVWIQDGPGRPVRNLTNGATDGSGWWNPQWSTDGKRLAMLSSRGGTVAIWVWDRATDQLHQLQTPGIDFVRASSQGVSFTGANYREVFRWVGENRLVCLVLPEGERSTPMGSGGYFVGKGVERAMEAWSRAAQGRVTASVVDSTEFKFPERGLYLVDVSVGVGRYVGTTQASGLSGIQRSLWWLSPDGRTIAFVPHVPSLYQAFERSALGSPWPIELRLLSGSAPRLDRSLPMNVVTETIRWSPDGKFLAFFAYGDERIDSGSLYEKYSSSGIAKNEEPERNLARLWRVDIEHGRVEQVDLDGIDLGPGPKPPALMWTASGEILLPARAYGDKGVAQQKWLVLGRDGSARPLVEEAQGRPMRHLPDSLYPLNEGAAFVGLVDGEIWRIDSTNGGMINLTANLTPRVTRIFRPDDIKRKAVISVGEPEGIRSRALLKNEIPVALGGDYVLDLETGRTSPIGSPAASPAVVAFHERSESAIYFSKDGGGTYLWRVTNKKIDALVAANKFLGNIEKGPRRRIEYTTLNGEKMSALLVLPANYVAGRHYPLVVDFDIGSSPASDMTFALSSQDTPDPVADTFSAAGYAYLYAAWPVTSMDDAGRANLLLGSQGVVPAAEKAIELGVADPDRLFLYGMSSAGYGVFALVTQTSRFKAAVASVGWVDQISHSLTMYPELRYTDNPFDSVYVGAFYSTYHELPFWLNADHLRRNSPLNYVDRVRTPLMIVHSDFDKTSITQQEMFFKALVLQHKPARFVRYWGEGHGNQTPANERDMFQRIFAWYDDYGDIARDAGGRMIFDGTRVKSRKGARALSPEDYSRFGPAAPSSEPDSSIDWN